MLSSVWKNFLEYVENHPQKNPMVLSLLRQLNPVELKENQMILECENNGVKLYLEKKKLLIEQLLFGHLKQKVEIRFTIKEKKQKTEAPLFQFQPSQEDVFHRAGIHIKHTFENYAVSTSNNIAYAAAQAVAHNPGSSYNPLFLYGGVGVGKTHLAQAAARFILEKDHEKKVYFCPSDQFLNELIESIREKSTAKFRRKYRHLSLLIVDDIQFIAGKTSVQEEFFHTFNSIVSAGGQIILTSDRPPSDIKNLEDRLRSRFSGGLIVDIQAPDFELRAAILLIKAKEKGIEMDMEAARIIAETVTDSRALEGTLLSIYARTLGKKERIDLDVVDEYFQDKVEKVVEKRIDPSVVIKTVCSYYNIKQSHIKSSTRIEEIAMPRQIIMYILREQLKIKLEEIARILKRKDHTTIMHGVEKVNRLVIKDPALKEEVDKIMSLIRSST